jgi:hypothetical protein
VFTEVSSGMSLNCGQYDAATMTHGQRSTSHHWCATVSVDALAPGGGVIVPSGVCPWPIHG